jgi:two-component system CheB/CheR fusion protein
VQIAIVMVDGNMRIRRFTPMAERLLNLIPGDVGRPIGDIKPNFDTADLQQLIAEAVDDVKTTEREVTDHEGNRLSLRVRPYKNLENKIDGAVLAVFDTEAAHRHAETQAAWDYANALLETVHEPLLVLDVDLRVRTANTAFLQVFRVNAKETEDRLVYELGNGQWNIPKLRSLLEKVLPENEHIVGHEVEHEFPGIGRRRVRLNARRVDHGDRERDRILLAIVDVTDLPPERRKH